MKVNIKGRGIVPRVNQLAPVYNVDLSKRDVQFLLNIPAFKVYQTSTGLLIRNDTIDEMFAALQKPVEKPIIKEKPVVVGVDIAKETKPIEPTPVVDVEEIIPEEAEEINSFDNTQEDVVDTNIVEDTEDVDNYEITSDTETTDDENEEVEDNSNQSYPSKKNKKNKKHRS